MSSSDEPTASAAGQLPPRLDDPLVIERGGFTLTLWRDLDAFAPGAKVTDQAPLLQPLAKRQYFAVLETPSGATVEFLGNTFTPEMLSDIGQLFSDAAASGHTSLPSA